ncbi:MAG: site-specific integrase [Geothrix sp.]|nr:site-specific integrase [Geothrix sp.]
MPKLSTTKLVDSRIKDLVCSQSQKDGSEIPATYWDSEVRGFGIQVMPSGTKTFFFKYKSPVTKKQAWYRLCRYTGPASVAKARKRAIEVQGLVEDKKDPKVEEEKITSIPTVAKLVDRFIAEHYSKKSKSTQGAAKRLLSRIVVPVWGDFQPAHITRPMVQDLFQKVSDGWRPGSKEKNPDPTPIQANRLIAFLSKLFNWSEKNGFQPQNTNPCRHIEKNPENKRERYLSDDEVQALHLVLDQEEDNGNAHQAAAVRLLLFTGARLMEIRSLRWSQVELQRDEQGKEVIGGTIVLKEHKTAGKMGTKILPLNPQAAKELGRLANFKRQDGAKLSPFVFPGPKAGTHMRSLQRFWERVRVEAGIPDVHTHDLRHAFGAAGISVGL